MELVLDANILVAAFLRSATTRELLLDERLALWTPEHSITETERVLTAPRLRKRLGNLSAVEVRNLLSQLTAKIHVVPITEYYSFLPAAEQLAPHTEDAPYLALAMRLRLPIWSNDAGLKEQQNIRVYTTEELLDLLRP